MIGKILAGRYYIITYLGGGGFGQTYVTEDRQLPGNPRCVVKQLKPQATEPVTLELARRLFDTEAQILHELGNHPQIPRLLAHFEENQEFYLVQEFIEGHDLGTEIIPGDQWSESDVINLLRDILEVLAFVHQKKVIHRDIKPANIRRRQDGKIVLIDFGAVKQIRTQLANSKGTISLTIGIGTPGYMPNEQANSKPKLSSDIYAVGIVAIQALTGLHPSQFTEDPRTGEISWHNHATISPRLTEILDKMVRYDFRQRYESAVEALQAVNNLGNQVSPTTISSSPKGTIDYTATVPATIPKKDVLKLIPWQAITALGIAVLAVVSVLNFLKPATTQSEKSAPQTSPITSIPTQSQPIIAHSSTSPSIVPTSQPAQVSSSQNVIPVVPQLLIKPSRQSNFYLISDAAYANASDAEQEVRRLQAAGYTQAEKFWIPDYPNLSGKSLFVVSPGKFSDHQSCADFLNRYAQQSPDAYCIFASKNTNIPADRFYASSLGRVSNSLNSAPTQSKQLKGFYFISDTAFKQASQANSQVKLLQARGYSQAGTFWIPDYPNLSGKPLFLVYPANFSTRLLCANFLKTYKQQSNDAYCAFASKDRNAPPDRFK